MILEFSVSNFRSVCDLQTISFVAAPIVSTDKNLDLNNKIKYSEDLDVLRSIALYGANGSGKSNMIKALASMLIFIRLSFKDNDIGSDLIEPFLLSDSKGRKPTFFQIIFISGKKKYRYGFEYYRGRIVSEWLFGPAQKNEVYYFTREGSQITVNKSKFKEGLDLTAKTKERNLFLNICYAFNGSVSNSIKDYFDSNFIISTGMSDEMFKKRTMNLLKRTGFKERIIGFMNYADFGINEIEIEDDDRKSSDSSIQTVRNRYNSKGKISGEVHFSFNQNESEGTQKMFCYSGVILNILDKGGVIAIDEFDARLHPILTKKILQLFNDSNVNKKSAQILFVTHDTNLLDKDLLRRDQIYFAEKNKLGETKVYSLADFKGVRNDASFEKDYIKGKYGAIPYIGDINMFF